jgi:hypothetical protein
LTELGDKRFVFICGLHRSGTSVLFRALRGHPQVSGFEGTGSIEEEGQFLQSIYPPGHRYGGVGVFGLNPGSHLDERSPLASPANARRLYAEWARYWDTDRPVLLEKSPPNLVRTRFLQSLFPNASFVVPIRHPVAVSLSSKAGRPRLPLATLIEHWLVCHERFLADVGHLRRVYTFRYEDWSAAPQRILDELWDFLGLERAPLAEAVRSRNEPSLRRWREMRARRGARLYRRWIVRAFEARVARWGYSLAEPERLSPWRLAEALSSGAGENLPRVTPLSWAVARGAMYWERAYRAAQARLQD